MRTELESELIFGAEGVGTVHYSSGWSVPERGFTWAVGDASSLSIAISERNVDRLLELWLAPFTRPPELPSQRLVVRVNGVAVANDSVAQRSVRAYRIPAYLCGERLHLTFVHPDAARPSEISAVADSRSLSFSFTKIRLFRLPTNAGPRAFSGPSSPRDQDLALAFHNLGDNCEFGLVQRRLGAEPVGLLRFSGQPLDLLVRAIDEDFRRFEHPDNVELVASDPTPNYSLYIRPYGIHYHTFVKRNEMNPVELHDKQLARLKFLARLLLTDMAESSKIFVFKRGEVLRQSEILPLFAALNRKGPNHLLFLRPANTSCPPGSVNVIMPGLMCGYVSAFGSYRDAQPQAVPDWAAVCREALTLASSGPDMPAG